MIKNRNNNSGGSPLTNSSSPSSSPSKNSEEERTPLETKKKKKRRRRNTIGSLTEDKEDFRNFDIELGLTEGRVNLTDTTGRNSGRHPLRPYPHHQGPDASCQGKCGRACYLTWRGIFLTKRMFQAFVIILCVALGQFSFILSGGLSLETAVSYSVFVGLAAEFCFILLDLVNDRCSRKTNPKTYELEFSYIHPLTFLNYLIVLTSLVVCIYFTILIKETCMENSNQTCVIKDLFKK